MFERKNLRKTIKEKDIIIGRQLMTIECLKEVINSLEEDNNALREEAYKTVKKSTTRRKKKEE